MFEARDPLPRTRRLSLPVAAVVLVLLIAAGLIGVVNANLQTSADIRKESEESHILSEMQVALSTVEQALATWTIDRTDKHPREDPEVIAAIAHFGESEAQLIALIDADEQHEVEAFAGAFDDFVAAMSSAQRGSPQAEIAALERAVRGPLLALLEEENDHLMESVEADRRSEVLLGWGLPLLLGSALIVLFFVLRLQRSSRLLDQERRIGEARSAFIASVSHELRTPLTPVVALSHEMRDRLEDFTTSELVEFASTIARSSDEVSAIVDDLLVAARMESGQLSISARPLDVKEQIDQAVATISRSDGIEIEATGTVLADDGRLRQILRNLMSNAERYGGRQIKVTTHQGDDTMMIVVADSGSGIPAELREQVFEPFATAHHVTGVPASVGLGLTVSRNLAALMGGTLTYTYENGWSRLHLVLPTPSAH